MANDIDRTLAEAAKSSEKIQQTMEKTEKALIKASAEKFARYIRDGAISSEKLKEELEKAHGNIEDVNEEFREVILKAKEAAEATEKWNQEMKELGEGAKTVAERLTGLTIPGLTVVKLLTAAATTTVDWMNHTAAVNRQFYDMEANLGNIGKRSMDFESHIRGVSTALNMPIDDVRQLGTELAGIGFTTTDIKDGIQDVAAMTTLWSEVTPEKQMQLMSDYIKQFGMNGKEATDTMLVLYDTANKLKSDVMPKLDIKAFVDQTHDVALEMRQYGLEAQDAIALTATLVGLGVEQARVGEIAAAVGGAGMGDAATVAFMATQAEGAGAAMKEGGITQVMGEFLMNDEKRLTTQTDFLDKMLKAATGTEGLAVEGGASVPQLVGALSQLDLPGIGKMSVQQAKEFGKAVDDLRKTEGVSLKEAVQTALKETEKGVADARNIAADHLAVAKTTGKAVADYPTQMKVLLEAQGSKAREATYKVLIAKEAYEGVPRTERERERMMAAATAEQTTIYTKQMGAIERAESPEGTAKRERLEKAAASSPTMRRTMAAVGDPVDNLSKQIDKLADRLDYLASVEIKVTSGPELKTAIENTKSLTTGEAAP